MLDGDGLEELGEELELEEILCEVGLGSVSGIVEIVDRLCDSIYAYPTSSSQSR